MDHISRVGDDGRSEVAPWPVNEEGRLQTFLSHGIVAGVIIDKVPLALSVKKRL
jgi:hypothetical protein